MLTFYLSNLNKTHILALHQKQNRSLKYLCLSFGVAEDPARMTEYRNEAQKSVL